MLLRDAVVFQSLDFDRMPAEPEIRRGVVALAASLTARAAAPKGEDYSGPVLFEGRAGAQLFAEVLGRNLALSRRPVMEPGRGGAVPVSELEGRQGARILPESFDVVDDPTQKEWRGRPLFGSYEVDREGVAPQAACVGGKGSAEDFSAHAAAGAGIFRLQWKGAFARQLWRQWSGHRQSFRARHRNRAGWRT